MQTKLGLLDEIIGFYKSELSNKNLVLKYINKYYISFLILVCISLILMIANVIWDLENNKLYIATTLLSIISYITLFFIINHKAKKLIKSKYNIKQEERFWGGYNFYRMKVKKLEDKILQIDPLFFDKSQKIDLLLEMLTEDAQRLKPSFVFHELFLPGLALGFIIPMWSNIMNQFYSVLYTKADMHNLFNYTYDAIFIAFLWCTIIFIIVLTIGAIRMIVKDIIEREYNERKVLIKMIKQIKLNNCINSL